MPTSRLCVRRRRCWPRVPTRPAHVVAAVSRGTPGCCSPRWRPSSASGRPSSPRAQRSVRPRRPAHRALSASVRPTTWFATQTGSSASWSSPSASTGTSPSRSTSPVWGRALSRDPFVHLHVASGYSLQYGASHPHVLVERAVEHEMDTLALTDRDGLYGAVRFAKACMQAGVRPVLGVDLAVAPTGVLPPTTPVDTPSRGRGGVPRTPARGGSFRDPRLPRVTFLATSKQGWAALCRLVSATHLAGERGTPVTSLELVAEHLGGGSDVLVLLGPGSELGQ